MRYVVVYLERQAIVIDAPNEERAKTRALAVLRNGSPSRDVTVEKVELGWQPRFNEEDT